MRFSTAVPPPGGRRAGSASGGMASMHAQLDRGEVGQRGVAVAEAHDVGGAPARVVRGAWVDEEPGAIGQADGAIPQRAIGCPGEAGDVSAPAVALAHAAAARVAEDFGAGDLGHEPDDTMPIVSRRDP